VPGQTGELHTPQLTQPSGTHLNHIAGVVTYQIGTGDNAQNAIVYRTILWSFLAGGIFSAAAFILAVVKSSPSPLAEIKDVWSIFAPLITLALGYTFGKSK
jgi:hypothetical protein